MPFTSSVLDDFNRSLPGSGVDPAGPNWPEYSLVNTPSFHEKLYVGQVSSSDPNVLGLASTTNGSGYYTGYWGPLPNLTNFEAYFKAVRWPQGGAQGFYWIILGRIQNPGTTNAKGTGVFISMATNDFTYIFQEWTNAVATRSISGSLGSVNFAFNDMVGLRMYERASNVHFPGTILELWTKRAVDGNQWVKQGNVLDTYPDRILSPGPLGMLAQPNITGQRMSWDDFSVAEVSPPSSDVGYTARGSSGVSLVGDKSIPGGKIILPDDPYLSNKMWTASMFEGEEVVGGEGGGGISIYTTNA
jgi:hypothetical protein